MYLLLQLRLAHPSTNPTGQPVNPPPGMSESGWKRSLGETQLKPEQLEETKLGIVKFISSGVFGEQTIVPHLVVAAADTRFSVANAADSALKRIGGYKLVFLIELLNLIYISLFVTVLWTGMMLRSLQYCISSFSVLVTLKIISNQSLDVLQLAPVYGSNSLLI